jgi:hypothetical protein
MFTFFNEKQYQELLQNGSVQERDKNHAPVVKLFLSGTSATWLLSEINPEDQSIAFGLCDLGMGFPELGSVDLVELDQLRSKYCLQIEQDFSFEARCLMSVYLQASRMEGFITTKEDLLRLLSLQPIAKKHLLKP